MADDAKNRCPAGESNGLAVGTRLAALAIETRRLYSDLEYRAAYDRLTGVYNRATLEDQLDAQIEGARREDRILGLIYVDLNDFKYVNDTYGHSAGDFLLQQVALQMKGLLRSNDILARLGGDESVILIPTVRSREEVLEISQRLTQGLDCSFVFEGHLLHASASIGVAYYPDDGTTRESLLSTADASMYVAKEVQRQDKNPPAEQSSMHA